MDQVNFTFDWPWMLLLLPLPLLFRWLMPAKHVEQTVPTVHFPYISRIREAFSSAPGRHNNRQKRLPMIMLGLLWLCLVLAMMRPQWVNQIVSIDNKGYDIMLAVDLSGSMRALDFSTATERLNRLDVAKQVVQAFVKDRQSDRVGLVLFGEHAYQYSPLTKDTQSVSQMLNETVVSMAGDGTAIGDALGIAVKGLRHRPENSRIIILLTDGEDTASSLPPKQAIDLAKQYNIKIYTIGIGHNGLVPYPDQYGRIINVQMSLDEKLLKQIASETGGHYFHADNREKLQQVYHDIDQLEKTKAESRHFLIEKPLYRYPLSLALLCLLILLVMPMMVRRKVDAI